MKTYKISTLSLLPTLLFSAGCSDRKKFFEDGRYKKMVCTISNNNNVHSLVYNLDGKDGNIRSPSIACSGTNPIEEPVTISLTEGTILLDRCNHTNFIKDYSRYAPKVDPEDYTTESNTVTYPAGGPYTLVPIRIDISITESLNPDKIYFIPIAITDATPYLIVKKKGNALLRIQKKNRYTSLAKLADYNASGCEDNGCSVTTKTMAPLIRNRVRINIGTKRLPVEPESQPDFIKKNTIVVEVTDDSSLTVKPYDPEEMEVETVDVRAAHLGDNVYALYDSQLDLITTTFRVCHKYRLKTDSWAEVREVVRLPVTVIE